MTQNRERARHYGVILAVVMLALLMPLTIFLAQKENDIRSRASVAAVAPSGPVGVSAPPFYGVGPCPPNDFCPSPGISPNVSGANPNPSSGARPSTSVNNPNPSSVPCEATGASLATNKKEKKSKHKEHNGGISGFMEALLRFFTELINLILRLFGGGQIPLPDGGNPNPTNPNNPNNPTDPGQPAEPCQPSGEPSAEPSEPVAEPSTTVPSIGVNPSNMIPSSAVLPSQGAGANLPTAATCATATAPIAGYSLTKCEDFNGTTIPSGWTAYDGGGGDTVVGVGRKPAQCTVSGGILTQTQNADGATCGMTSNFAQKYGYWEVKMRAYATGTSGSAPHPVLILWPDTDVWADGELDYFESDIGDADMGVFLHCIGNPASNCYSTKSKVDIAQWHVYGFEWTAAGFKGYVDGKEIYATGGNGSNPTVSMHQTIQLDNLTKQTPAKAAKMEVDWVHMYKKN